MGQKCEGGPTIIILDKSGRFYVEPGDITDILLFFFFFKYIKQNTYHGIFRCVAALNSRNVFTY
jgi:hypothetical protein